MKFSSNFLKVLLIASPLILTACGGDDDDDGPSATPTPTPTATPTMTPTPTPTPTPDAEYRVTVLNTTHNQPLSPVAVVLDDEGYRAWAIGSAASDGLAVLAESGSPAEFLAEYTDEVDQAMADGITAPGSDVEITVSGPWDEDLSLTVVTMLVNTNDAFVGTTGWQVGHLEIGDSMRLLAPVYDAGTEANTETAESIPGPAAGGAGVSEGRETRDQVTRHPGVVTQDDGYAESALDESHRFDNGAMLIRVERTM